MLLLISSALGDVTVALTCRITHPRFGRRYRASLRMQRVADQAQAAKTEASDTLAKETALRSKLEVLCKELQKRNLEMKVQLSKQQEEQLKSHQSAAMLMQSQQHCSVIF